jgi:DNA-binding SARP family transcriptional activator
MPPSGGYAAAAVEERPMLSLLGGFSLRIGVSTIALPLHARRVLAYLSLDKISEPGCNRGLLAERLWPDAPVERCRASLRTALWRVRRASPALLCDDVDRVSLGDAVEVDVHRFRRQAKRLLSGGGECGRDRAQLMARTTDLLPGWDESWLLLAREQLRQLRLHALEVEAHRLAERGRYPEVIDVMLAVVAEEPLRESAQTALIEAHLCEGNVFEARRQFDMFAKLLWNELGIRPSAELYGRVGAVVPPTSTDNASPRSINARVVGSRVRSAARIG